MTRLRCDAGAGTEREINWGLEHGDHLLTKLKNHQRTCKLVQTVRERWVGWVEQAHAFARPTLQVAIRTQRNNKTTERVLLTSLCAQPVMTLLKLTHTADPSPKDLALAVAHLYDQRGGGVETQNRNDKQGLGLTKRNRCWSYWRN